MGVATIPVDLFNPGQVFACLGFLEAADVLVGEAQGGFDWRDEADVRFVLRARGDQSPVAAVLGFLAEAAVVAIAPKGCNLSDQWGIATESDSDGVFPVAPYVKDGAKRSWIKESALPIRLSRSSGQSVSVSHWADVENGRISFKTWGGAQGKSGASRMSDLLASARPLISSSLAAVAADPFSTVCQIGGFRMDMSRDYVPIDIGFSPNAHKGRIEAAGHPVVEIAAVIGLESARPQFVERLAYRYGAWRGILSPLLARPALGCASPASAARMFLARLGEPNKYDRSILDVTEELMK